MTKKKKLNAKPSPSKQLNDKKFAFVEEYLKDFNGGRAYRATYGEHISEAAAPPLGSRLLRDDTVQQYLKQRLEERKQELHVDQQYVVRKLLDITEADYVDTIQYVTQEQLDKIPKEIRKFIQSIKLTKNRTMNRTNAGDYENETEKYEVTFMSKDKALELLGRHTGAFMKDNIQGQYDMAKMSFTDALKHLDI